MKSVIGVILFLFSSNISAKEEFLSFVAKACL